MTLKPNTICKNRNCNKGEDGGRKHYYACHYCAHSENWRAMACSWECYMEYQAQIIESRRKEEPVNLLPERTDMTQDEVKTLIFDTPTEEVIQMTETELAAEIEEHPAMGFDELVDHVNEKLDKQKTSKKKK